MATECIVDRNRTGDQVIVRLQRLYPSTRGDIHPMNSSQNDGPEDLESGTVAAEQSETRMRQALERLSGDKFPQGSRPQAGVQQSFSPAGPRRHRYVQDGEVPVVQISSLRDRRRDPAAPAGVAAEQPSDNGRAALAQERTARQRAEQALERAMASLHALETRLGHAEITQHEAAEQARAHQVESARLQSELAAQAALLEAAQARAGAAEQRQAELEVEMEDARAAAADQFVAEPPSLRPRSRDAAGRATSRPTPARAAPTLPEPVEADEPEPVKWWLTPPPKLKSRSR